MSSSSNTSQTVRRSAFARTPRGANPAGSSTPALGVVRIDAKFIESLHKAQLNTDLSTVLTATQADLSIKIGANGASMIQAQRPNGLVVADEADIRRVMSLNVALNQERKEAQKQEAGPNLIANLAAIVDVSKQEGHQIAQLPKAMPEVYRSANVPASMIMTNTGILEDYSDSSSKELRSILLDLCKRARSAVGEYLLHRANLAEHEEAQKINTFIRKAKCPIYFFNKLASERINTSAPGFNLQSIVWPNDPTKGFYLTFREIIEAQMHKFCGKLTSAWSVTGLLMRPAVLEAFTGAKMNELVEFDDATKIGSKVANVPFFIPAPSDLLKPSAYFDFLSKNGGRGIQWKSGMTLNPQDHMRFLGTVARRVQYLSVPNATLLFRKFEIAFPGFTYNPESADKDIFGQLKQWSILPNSNFTWMKIHNLSVSEETTTWEGCKDLLQTLLVSVLHAPQGTHAGDLLNQEIRTMEYETPDAQDLENPKDFLTEIKRHAQVNRNDLDSAKVKISGLLDPSTIPGVKGKKFKPRRAGITERTTLSSKAKQVLTALNAKGYSALATRMDGWFRQFLNEDCQSSVATLFLARLDTALSAPITLDRRERLAFLEKDDYAVSESGSEVYKSESDSSDEEDKSPHLDNPDDA